MRRHLIVNADDFGASVGINRGIVDAHRRGIVTSTSLMVDRHAAEQAAQQAAGNPGMSIGLHFEEPSEFEALTEAGVSSELERQLTRFHELLRRGPTHIDSHHHVHRDARCSDIFAAMAAELGVPLREASGVAYIGGFYAQWEWQVTNLEYVSVDFLQQILRTEVSGPWTELGCHPGYVSDDYSSVYLTEREAEVDTLTDARVRETLSELDIELSSYADYAALTGSRP